MSMQQIEATVQGTCPVCAGMITLPGSLVETEILACPECQSMLVMEGFRGGSAVVSEAPQIEEDWGE